MCICSCHLDALLRVNISYAHFRLLAPAAAIRRTIIRHLVLVLDLSAAMLDRDMRPTRFDLMLQYAREFVTEWFDQNPLGQIGVVGMRAGLGERIGEMSGMNSQSYTWISLDKITGNPQEVLKAIADRHKMEPVGEPSLQNAVEMARGSMRYESCYLWSLYLFLSAIYLPILPVNF